MKKILLAVALVAITADLSYGQTCQAWVNGAKARASKNLWKEANTVLGENLSECESHAEYRYFYGITLAQAFPADSAGKAIEQLRAADELTDDEELQPGIGQALVAMWGPLVNEGIQLLNTGDIEGARDQLNMAVELNPEGKEGHFALGAVHQVSQDYDAAIASYRRALEIDPSYKSALTRLGMAYQEKAEAMAGSGDAAQVAGATEVAAEAVVIYETFLADNPDDFDVKIQLAGLYSTLGQQDKAQPIIEQIAGSDEVNAQFLTQLGFQQAQARNDALAENLLSRAVTLTDTLWSEPLEYLGFVRIRQNDLPGARVALESQLELDPSNAQAWEYYAFVLRDLGETAGAQEAFRKFAEIPLELQNASMSQDPDSTWNVEFTFANRLESEVSGVRVQIHLVSSEDGRIIESQEVTVAGPLGAGQVETVRVEFDESAPDPRIRYEIAG
ncbi:MAG TPA: tetratricopeptide repeat protein [Gemmatimonadota bacterium]|nr:tetratricopeptide repeat protein [Gemmatimonadota bacterium]